MRRLIALLAAASCTIGVGACGDDGYSDDPSPAKSTSTNIGTTAERPAPQSRRSRERGRTTTLKVVNSRYGKILADGSGRALYLFTREKSVRSRCYGQCAVAWPPFYARGTLRAGSGAESARLGTSERRDGRRIVTYNGHPLYYYVTDRKPGQVTCHDVDEFGGTWLVVNPDGNAVS
jgi:predicted lipoprotein with Yx(FWY)xxD motif